MSNQKDLDDQLYILLASMKEYREAIADDNKRLEAFYKEVASGVLVLVNGYNSGIQQILKPIELKSA